MPKAIEAVSTSATQLRVAPDAARSWPGASAPRASRLQVSQQVATGTGRAGERVIRWPAKVVVNEVERKRVENTVAAFVEKRRPPVHLRGKVDLGFHFDGRSVELFEIRPRWDKPAEKIKEAVAKARYLKSRNEWLVYWQRADLKWHKYGPTPEVDTLEAFLALVDEDEYGCFFG